MAWLSHSFNKIKDYIKAELKGTTQNTKEQDNVNVSGLFDFF